MEKKSKQNLAEMERQQFVPLDMKGCICHFVKWQIHVPSHIERDDLSTITIVNAIVKTYLGGVCSTGICDFSL